jgi:hypothetical protein
MINHDGAAASDGGRWFVICPLEQLTAGRCAGTATAADPPIRPTATGLRFHSRQLSNTSIQNSKVRW